MDEGLGSSRGSVMKKKKDMNSSGCLSSKKKGGNSNVSRSGKTSYSRKKKPSVVSSDSESSQESLPPFDKEVASTHGNFRNNVTDDSDSGRNCGAVSDKKRRLDVFEFDEYDASDEKKIRKENLQSSFKLTGKGRNSKKSECDSNRHVVVEKRKYSSSDSAASNESSEDDDGEAHLPIALLTQKSRTHSDDAVRLQGKNAVLKVMASKKKLDTPHKRKSSEAVKESRKEKNHKKPKEESQQGRGSSSRAKSEGKTSSSQKIPPSGAVKRKRGSGTEKQLLRERVKQMLIEAGWTIDYRPRKNRDYLDSVYINPSGSGFWSITKAYDALEKQLEEEDDVKVKPEGNSDGFTPLPGELINKLTRQTGKKIKKERKMKKREGNADCSDDDDGDDTDNEDDDDETDNEDEDDEKQEISDSIQGRKNSKMGRCTLLARSSDEHRTSESDNYIPYKGKRTVLLWLIDSGTVHLSEKVKYMNRRQTKVMLEGWISKDGIHCGCCSKILSIPKFEIHAGSKLRQPLQNIFLESGSSLLQCQIDAWNKQDSKRQGFHNVHTDSDDPNDDTCGLCGDGGDLICCDGCPSTFHQNCLGLKMLPDGDWHCLNCTCKYCGMLSENIPEAGSTSDSALIRCNLCEKRYHESCRKGITDSTMSLCGKDCKRIFDRMEKILGVKRELEGGFSWSLIRRSDLLDQRNSGSSNKVESNSKLAVALSVMDECFLPIVDRRSGFNIIHNVLYNCGSNFSRLNYSGFYTAILEKGDEIIAAASIRIHGTQLAEMPFIGTRHIYRRQGMCRRLLCAIESLLRSVKVNRLVIPAISEHMHTWKVAFGFKRLDDPHKQEMKLLNMLVFPGIDMLQKPLLENTSNIADSSVGQELPVCDDIVDDDEIKDKVSNEDSIMQEAVIPSSDNLGLIENSPEKVCSLDCVNEETKAVLVDSICCPSKAPVPDSVTAATEIEENGTEKLETGSGQIFATEIKSQEAVIPSNDNPGLSENSPEKGCSLDSVNEEAKAVLAESIYCPSEAPVPDSETPAIEKEENGKEKVEIGRDEIFATEIESQEAVIPSSDNLGLRENSQEKDCSLVSVNEEAKAVFVESIYCPSEAPVPDSESPTKMEENGMEKVEISMDEIFAKEIESQEAVIPSSDNLGLRENSQEKGCSLDSVNEEAKAVLVESIYCPSEAPVSDSGTPATKMEENGKEKVETGRGEIFAMEIESQEAVIPSSDNLGLSEISPEQGCSLDSVNEETKAVLVESISRPSEAPVPDSETPTTKMEESGKEKVETGRGKISAMEIESQEAVIPSSDNLGLSENSPEKSCSLDSVNEETKAVLVESISSHSEAPVPDSETPTTKMEENGKEKVETGRGEIFAMEIETQEAVIPSSDNLGLSENSPEKGCSLDYVNEETKAVLVESISCLSEAPVPDSESVATATEMEENGTVKVETGSKEIFATEIENQEAVIPSRDNLGLSKKGCSLDSSYEEEAKAAVLVESIPFPSEAPVSDSETAVTEMEENGTEKVETGIHEIFAMEIESQRANDTEGSLIDVSDAKLVPVNANNVDNGSDNTSQETNGVSVSPLHKTDENISDCISELNQTVAAHDVAAAAAACKLPLIDDPISSMETTEKLSPDGISNGVDTTMEMTNEKITIVWSTPS